jgi:DNA primase
MAMRRIPDDSRRQVAGSSSLYRREGELVAGRLPAVRRGMDFPALRAAVPIGRVLELIGWEPCQRSGPQARGPCPIHQSTTPRSRSFSVNLDSNMFQCFGCGAKGNQICLWMAVSGLPVYEAALDLIARLHMDPNLFVKPRNNQP